MRATIDQTLTPALQLQLYLLTGLVLLPHVLHLPWLVSLFLFAALAWRLVSLYKPRLQPGRWLLIPITLAGVLLTYSQHQTLIGREAGVSLLSVMLVLKTLEVRRRRDLTITVFIAYFVIITQFLFNQSFFMLLFMLLMLIGHTALLLAIELVDPPRHFFEPYRRTIWITIQALPIALILFVLFPRLTQPLWRFGYDSGAVTGLSERVTPGSISQLTLSSEVVFRVNFRQPPPPPETRYWRALVLWDTDGFSWFNKKDQPLEQKMPRLVSLGEGVEYEIFLEPHRERWLYALDMPAIAHNGASLTPDFLLKANQPVNRPLKYAGISFTQYRVASTPEEQLQRALRLDKGVTIRQRQLVGSWQRTDPDPQSIVQSALDYFNRHPFVYTLNPPVYRDNPVDQFLFESREGFCEHYASAFTQLMRIAGVPARMVIGFQGGEYNRLGEYFTVRAYDAHAWSEVWLEHRGWVRVDPTAAVAPERIRRTIQTGRGLIGEPVRFLIDQNNLIGSALKDIGMLLDAAEINWRMWVLGYSSEEQFSLMRELGLDFLYVRDWGVYMTIALIFGVLALIGVLLVMQGRVKHPQAVRLYRLFCHRMASIGLPRAPSEGPLDYSFRTCRQRPDLAPQIVAITRLYIGLRYGAQRTRPQRQAFSAQVRRFRPRRLRRAG
jgi:hypothetical protein